VYQISARSFAVLDRLPKFILRSYLSARNFGKLKTTFGWNRSVPAQPSSLGAPHFGRSIAPREFQTMNVIGVPEMLLLVLLALLLSGPEELPEMGRTLRKALSELHLT